MGDWLKFDVYHKEIVGIRLTSSLSGPHRPESDGEEEFFNESPVIKACCSSRPP